jgi:serine/threonine-protein kinase MRCK
LKEAMPISKNSGFKGYHLPFVGFTFTENCILNDCHSLLDFFNIEPKSTAMEIDDSNSDSEKIEEYKKLVAKLEKEKLELLNKLNLSKTSEENNDLIDSSESKMIESSEAVTNSEQDAIINELRQQLDASKAIIEDLNVKLSETSNAYDIIKQAELDQKNKIKHLERNLRALKNEKDELFTVIISKLFQFIIKRKKLIRFVYLANI